jgi:hypothetical protein
MLNSGPDGCRRGIFKTAGGKNIIEKDGRKFRVT